MFISRRIATTGGDKFRDEFSLEFDGTDEYIHTDFTPDYIHTNATMGMWVYFKSISEQTIGHHGNKRWYMGIDGSGDCFMGVADAHTGADNVSGGIVANKWFHITVTAIDGTATFYVDGVAKHTTSYTQNSSYNPDAGWLIGARNHNGTPQTYTNAKISEVFHYDVGLTASQVKTLYNGREPYNHKEGIISNNLKGWWRMGDGTLDSTKYFTTVIKEGGVVSDESQPVYLGSNLVDNSDMMNDGSWTDWGTNVVSEDSGAIKITGDGSNSSGGYTYLRDSKGLTTDLTVGKVYKLTFQAKVNTGRSVTTAIAQSGGFAAAGPTISTDTYGNKAIYFVCTHATTHYFWAGSMIDGDEIWFKNIKLYEVVNNAGVLVNMDSYHFRGDTP